MLKQKWFVLLITVVSGMAIFVFYSVSKTQVQKPLASTTSKNTSELDTPSMLPPLLPHTKNIAIKKPKKVYDKIDTTQEKPDVQLSVPSVENDTQETYDRLKPSNYEEVQAQAEEAFIEVEHMADTYRKEAMSE